MNTGMSAYSDTLIARLHPSTRAASAERAFAPRCERSPAPTRVAARRCWQPHLAARGSASAARGVLRTRAREHASANTTRDAHRAPRVRSGHVARAHAPRSPYGRAISSRRLAAPRDARRTRRATHAPRDARAEPRGQQRRTARGARERGAARRGTRSELEAPATASRGRTSLSPSGAAASDSAPGIERVRARGAAPAGPEPTSTQRRRGTSTPPAARPRQPQGSAERRTTIPVDLLRWWSAPAPLLPHRARRKCPRRSVGASKKRADFAARPRANAREAAKTPTWVAAAALGAQDGAAPVRWRQSTRPGNSPQWACHLECPQTVGRISRPGALEESVRSSPDPPARICGGLRAPSMAFCCSCCLCCCYPCASSLVAVLLAHTEGLTPLELCLHDAFATYSAPGHRAVPYARRACAARSARKRTCPPRSGGLW